MKDLSKLLIAVHNGELAIEDLSEEQQEMVMGGYRELAQRLIDDPNFTKLGKEILSVLEFVDPFETAIHDAEARGSTFWEIESDRLH